ncbi:tRNA (adenosine(37)-N6)-threonylcarbamoyltransferase complex dimerization subunit type 1 TsaB [Bacillus songklensis]|uniref:tRNA (Adenosine(37)-N6)-threonylcarbamoyltransferase complex dimerization subunit type 1 TsaB n=1 Tax=Bacillus songklensis TaxID=1069116 RepID=A0ABV8B152_9BACI
MKTLAIDTSNFVMGIAILDNNIVIGEMITNIKKNHSLRVMPAIQSLLEDCGVKPEQLERIVVAEGPGSYTGVRIGVTIAKTLAWTLNIPLAGVSSLEVLAVNGRYFNGYICPLFDARRGQIYTGLYEYKNEELTTVLEDRLIINDEWVKQIKEYNKPILFLGNDLHLHRQIFSERLGEKAVFSVITQYNPRPGELGLLGMNKQFVENVHSFVPNYLRLAEAEANWLAAQKPKS